MLLELGSNSSAYSPPIGQFRSLNPAMRIAVGWRNRLISGHSESSFTANPNNFQIFSTALSKTRGAPGS